VRLAACCDAQEARSQEFARLFRVPLWFTDYAELLRAPDVDAVYLAVPHGLHFSMASAAIEAGKPLLLEKPITRTLSEGVRLVDRARQLGARIGVNYQYHYDVGCHALAQAARAGDLGRVHSVRINVPWKRELSYFQGSAWHQSLREAGGGTLLTQGSHFLDVALWALGQRPVSAMAYVAHPGFDVEVETLAHAIVETSGGALIQIASTMAASPDQPVTIEIYGDRGTGGFTNHPRSHAWFRGARVPRRAPPERGRTAIERSVRAFARWVREDRPYLVPAEDALAVLAAVDAVYRSATSGKRERID